jgi:hypothetical protein
MFGQIFNNLTRLFTRTFRKDSRKPLLKFARTTKQPLPKAAQASTFKIILAPPSGLVKTKTSAGTAGSQINA